MITAATFRKKALQFDQVSEKPHFEKASFRIREKIFATLDSINKRATLKLNETDQSVYCLIRPAFATPATGAWGKQGWTIFDLKKAPGNIITEALGKAYLNVAPKKKFQTLYFKKSTPLIPNINLNNS